MDFRKSSICWYAFYFAKHKILKKYSQKDIITHELSAILSVSEDWLPYILRFDSPAPIHPSCMQDITYKPEY
jgi:hypothetical protein